MPYRRRYGRKRYMRKRRYAKKSSTSITSIARNAAKGLIKYYLNPEHKYFDINNNAVAITAATGVLTRLTDIPQGDAANNRDGFTVRAVSIMMRASIENGSPTAGVNQLVRCILFIDLHKYAGASATSAELLEDPTNVRSPLNLSNRGRFRILYDSGARRTVNDQSNTIVDLNFFKRIHHHIKWDESNTATSGAEREGHITMLMLTDALANQPIYSVYTRLRFLDN